MLKAGGASLTMILAAWVTCTGPAGCAARLPVYHGVSDEQALAVIADRLERVRTISAEAAVTLSSPDGRSVHLDGAFVAAPPERARLRAWKLGAPALDLTVLPEGVWVFVAGRDAAGGPAGNLARSPASGVASAIELLSGGYFRNARPLSDESSAEVLVVIGPFAGQGGARCEIDRPTLTPRRFVLSEGPAPRELHLERYALVQGVAMPQSLRFRGADGEILVRLDAMEINTEPPPAAFVPPSNATRAP